MLLLVSNLTRVVTRRNIPKLCMSMCCVSSTMCCDVKYSAFLVTFIH